MEPEDEFARVEIEAFPEFNTAFRDDIVGVGTGQCAGSEGPNLYVTRDNQFDENDRSYVSVYGAPPIGCEPPPKRPPQIVSVFASSVGSEEATVRARINPKFWDDTTYQVEYGTGKCSEGGCPLKAPASAVLLTDKVINAPVLTAGVTLDNLAPGTTYHYRFVAESGGGGPVFAEGTFRTFAAPSTLPPCPNDAFRVGPAASLPDCRAYEMVSPLDKGNGDVAPWEARSGSFPRYFEMDLAAPSGSRFTYTAAFGFGGPEGTGFVSQYLTERTPAGWGSEPISPPRTESPLPATNTLDNEFQGFSEDLCQAWIRHYSVAPLAAGAIEKYPNIYRRHNCAPSPAYEAITVPEVGPKKPAKEFFALFPKGFSEDGAHTIFAVDDKLHPDAPTLKANELLLYEHVAGKLRFVCYLPSGKASGQSCSAGTTAGASGSDLSSLHNAISADGSRIFWTSYTGTTSSAEAHPGQIFVRIDGKETRKVSTVVTPEPAFFWTAADDGSTAIFEVAAGPLKGNLYSLAVDTQTPTLIAEGVEGPMGASEDASRVYFASTEDLDGTGPAAAGDHNLYLYEADPGGGTGVTTFLMELADRDIGPAAASSGNQPTRPVDRWASTRAARISPDGLHATFMSLASPTPTGYDNREGATDQPSAEVYLYDAVEDELRCVSCNPTGARPVADEVARVGEDLFAAARIQGWEFAFHAPRVLSDDGTRVFFESFEALVPRDTNATWDVYQWEEEGKGTCTTSRETFSEDSGGCVDLISAGTSPSVSTFLDADPSGDNIFFSTQSSLVGPDYGLNDVYVARVGGGFPEPQTPAPCAGEACQSPSPPLPEAIPPTETSSGAGNVTVKPKPRRCPKGKRRVRRAGKVKCVKRRRKAAHRQRARR
jgi:hypothetical protein